MLTGSVHALLVEDNPGDAALFQSMLAEGSSNFTSEHVDRLSVALDRLAKGGIDIVFLDLSLPDSQGSDTFKKVRTQFPEIPLILLTGLDDMEMGAIAIREGAQDYLVKGQVDASLLSRCVRYSIERKRSELRLLQSEKVLTSSANMAALGQLTGGVAHDFNNMLTIIRGYSEIMLKQLSPSDKNREMMEEINAAGRRASNLTKQLLEFGRKGSDAPTDVATDLNTIILQLESMLRRLLGEKIELILELSEKLPSVKIDTSRLEQIILNLAINARDAIEERGRITITTRTKKIEDDSYVELVISDSGHGMSDEVKNKMWEPFFTTKEIGKGTGLGLATVYGIIKQVNAQIDVNTGVSQGTAFHISFPTTDKVADNQVLPISLEENLDGKERILIVEDEVALGQLLKKVFEDHGYQVAVAQNGVEGFKAALGQSQGTFAVIISDVRMPKHGGQTLVSAVRKSLPHQKVIYMSGHVGNAFGEEGFHEDEITQFMQKPFSPIAMVEKVRRWIDSSAQ